MEQPTMQVVSVAPPISSRDLISRAGAEIMSISAALRLIEAAIVPVLLDRARHGVAASAAHAAMQEFDPVLQRLDGLSEVLIAASATCSTAADPAIPPLIDSIRIARLADHLRGEASSG